MNSKERRNKLLHDIKRISQVLEVLKGELDRLVLDITEDEPRRKNEKHVTQQNVLGKSSSCRRNVSAE